MSKPTPETNREFIKRINQQIEDIIGTIADIKLLIKELKETEQ